MNNFIKFAIVSDIHANKYALETFLQYLNEEFQANKILNLGDFLHIGPHPREVAKIIIADKRFINILGNNEMIVLGERKNEWPKGISTHRNWTINQLGEDLIEEIRKFPVSRTLKYNNKNILMLHSHFYDLPGRTIRDNLLLYQGKTIEEFIGDYPSDVDIVLLGHSHEQLYISWEGKKYINPGTLGVSKEPTISFCLMEMDSDKFNISFKKLNYDASRLKEDYIQKKVPERNFILNDFYPFL